MIEEAYNSKRKIKCIKTYEPRYPHLDNGPRLLKRGHTYTLIDVMSYGFWAEVVLEEFPMTSFDARLFNEIG